MISRTEAAVAALAALPDVPEAVERARQACTELRWHEGLRRRIPQAAAESRVRGATASALLEGAEPAGSEGSVDLVRDLMRGAVPWSSRPEDPVWLALGGAVRATAATEGVGPAQLAAPAQLIAALHTAATAGMLPEHQVGRPRSAGEGTTGEEVLGAAPDAGEAFERLQLVHELLRGLTSGRVPGAVVAAVCHAEIAVARPFVAGNGVVARALERVVIRVSGVDPTGVAVTESGHTDRGGTDYRGALAAYAGGGSAGVRLWVLHCAEGLERAAAHGQQVADAVRRGALSG
ncbi:Fic family protein [Ornithinimicrobium sp. LYQ92]|uniref:Fic family protein n=1 Tax=Serinicoccus sp. LYQ92 TaxID=3378798 RepID=UPI003854A07E